ncbi:MAG: class I adenylate cyclase [Deltaproteobacteria bacterium]
MTDFQKTLTSQQIQKRLRCQYVYDMDAEKASVVFEIIPLLLSINEADLPGYVSGGDSGCGVYAVGSSYQLGQVIRDYFPETKGRTIPIQSYLIKRPLVESLFLLGSVGTVAQTEHSDFDFWVCVDKTRCSRRGVQALEEKTAQIAYWCKSSFGMDVHFFVLDLEQIRQNDFGKVDEESSGSSQKKFLKEECYRTMLLVSGKIPYWWVVPSGMGKRFYQESWLTFKKKAPVDAVDFLDLGFLEGVSRNEFLGTALWQLSKGIKDPFKALIKMAMMEVYLSDEYHGTLLCDALKERVLGGSRFLKEMDPYLLLVETVLDFYREQDRIGHMELVKKAFYLKAEPGITRTKIRTKGDDYKVEVFSELMDRWEWRLDLVEDLNQIPSWSYGRQLKFSSEINRFFSSTYRRLSESLRATERQEIDQYDLEVLGKKLVVLFSKKRYKLRLTPFLTGRRLILKRCFFQYEKKRSKRKRWDLYDATLYATERKKLRWKIFSAVGIVKVAAWLVNNGLYDFQATGVEMPPNPSGVCLTDLIDLLKHLLSFFPPAYYYLSGGSVLDGDAVRDRIMVVIDMEELDKLKKLSSMDIVYKNSWGEMFTESYSYGEGLAVLEQYVSDLKSLTGTVDVGSRLRVHIPQSGMESDRIGILYKKIVKSLNLEEEEGMTIFRPLYGLERRLQFGWLEREQTQSSFHEWQEQAIVGGCRK